MSNRSISPRFHARLLALAISSVTLGLPLANAQELEPVAAQDTTVIYPASFFQPYNPVSANDMIDRIPGVSLSSSSSGRGLGNGGDLLINGQRLAGKDNSARDQLSRIAAREVERIEIIRGTSGELAVRGSGQVVNIVLQDTGTRASTSVEVSSDFHRQDETFDPGLTLSHNRQTGNFSTMFTVQADPQYRHEKRLENSYAADMTPTETMRESNVRDQTTYRTSATMGYRIGQHRMQLNGLYTLADHPVNLDRHYTDLTQVNRPVRGEREAFDYDNNNWELGGDYEYSFSNGHRANVLFIVNDKDDNYVRERFDRDTVESTDEEKSLFIASNARTRERIVQSSYSWPLADAQDMQVGVERAQTILDSSLLVGRNTGSTAPSLQFGGLRPALSSSNLGSTVEEMRYEGFAIHNWTLNDRMTLESSLVYETSEISQSGVVSKSRDFQFWRPSVDYRYNITDALQLRATVAKEVQQLSFSAFAATANTDDNDRDADAGNPNLVPTEEMRYELTLEYRLPNDSGVLSSRFFLRDLTNQIGRVDATTNPNSPTSAEGNIGDAKRWGVYLDGSTRLGMFGMPDALVSATLNLFDSSVTNPILGTTERINGRGTFKLGLRHDITRLNLNYGFDYEQPLKGGQRTVEINYIDWSHSAETLTMFVSTVLFNNITFRLESNNTLSDETCRNRVRYHGTSASGRISEVEDACWGGGQKLALKVRTTF
ncbi:MAG TPA: TonB-dependent receptor [Pseudohongiella sp.]|nr:TonB-dependent receptor [Pseudohongiella sp.]